MELKNLKFTIGSDDKLNKDETNFLVEAYRKLFAKMYGLDIVDAFLNVTKENSHESINNHDEIKKYAKNYENARKTLMSIQNSANIELLLIYDNNNLIGGGRLQKLSDKEASIVDLVIESDSVEVERDIWKKAVAYVENYLINQDYKKMYLEIPFQEGPLLYRADDLGFEENPDDIKIDEEVFTYVLFKDLERK